MHYNFIIDKDINKAETLPSKFYMNESIFELVKIKIFSKSWQWIGHEDLIDKPNSVCPLNLMDDFLDEPVPWIRVVEVIKKPALLSEIEIERRVLPINLRYRSILFTHE